MKKLILFALWAIACTSIHASENNLETDFKNGNVDLDEFCSLVKSKRIFNHTKGKEISLNYDIDDSLRLIEPEIGTFTLDDSINVFFF